MTSYYRYVQYADVPKFEAHGWVVCADLGPVHGVWSVLMLWTGKGEPS